MERILCAAVWYHEGEPQEHLPKNIQTGYVVCGRRHHNCINLHFQLTNKPTRTNTSTQGFLTSEDRFLNRQEAYQIAKKANQLLLKPKENDDHEILMSENLY